MVNPESRLGFAEPICLLPQATFEYLTDCHAFQKMCCRCHWALDWYALEETGRALLELQPSLVSVVRLEEFPPQQVWPVSGARGKKGKAKRQAEEAQGSSGSKTAKAKASPADSGVGKRRSEEGAEQDDESSEWDSQNSEPEPEVVPSNEALLLRAEAMDALGLARGLRGADGQASLVEEETRVSAPKNQGAAEASAVAQSSGAEALETAPPAAKARAAGVRGPTVAAAASVQIAQWAHCILCQQEPLRSGLQQQGPWTLRHEPHQQG